MAYFSVRKVSYICLSINLLFNELITQLCHSYRLFRYPSNTNQILDSINLLSYSIFICNKILGFSLHKSIFNPF